MHKEILSIMEGYGIDVSTVDITIDIRYGRLLCLTFDRLMLKNHRKIFLL